MDIINNRRRTMFIKNVSFEVLEAIKEDTKTILIIPPMEVKEVSEADGEWFKARYGDRYIVEVFESTPAPVVDEELVAKVEKKPEVKCSICGKVAKTPAGLTVHMRSHK